MSKDKNYSIGEFSARTGISIRTLHYYDEIGLLQPEKHPESGHRLYTDEDVLILQKIISLKFLGYRLEQICEMMNEPSFDLSLKETLEVQKKAFEEKKAQIETALKAINRTIALLEEENQIDNAILISLINSIQTEKEQRQWLEQRTSKEVAERLYNKPEAEMLALDKAFIHFVNEAKKLVRKPVDDPQVQRLIDKYMKATLQFVGEETMHGFGKLETIELDEIDKMLPSPFTKEEQEWLDKAMEHYMIQSDMYNPNANQEEGK